MPQVLTAQSLVDAAPLPHRPGDSLWLRADDLASATGWTLEPEGLCKDEACVPLAPGLRKHVEGDEVNASALWSALERPVIHDDARETWMLGESADDRSRVLESLEAPDFTLPDIEGKLHSLSDYRGKKVFLATWASW